MTDLSKLQHSIVSLLSFVKSVTTPYNKITVSILLSKFQGHMVILMALSHIVLLLLITGQDHYQKVSH